MKYRIVLLSLMALQVLAICEQGFLCGAVVFILLYVLGSLINVVFQMATPSSWQSFVKEYEHDVPISIVLLVVGGVLNMVPRAFDTNTIE